MNVEKTLAAIAQGDRTAFAELYRDQHRALVGYATGLLAGDREAGEDAVDEAFMVVWKSAADFSGCGSAQGWIRRIVRNKSIDQLRKCRELVGISAKSMAVFDQHPDTDPTPEEQAISLSDAANLKKALQMLSIEHREVIWLSYFEEKSVAEIAEISNCPANTVKTRLFYARQSLKSLIPA